MRAPGRRSLSQTADPRRPAAVEVEQVLEGDPAGALCRQRRARRRAACADPRRACATSTARSPCRTCRATGSAAPRRCSTATRAGCPGSSRAAVAQQRPARPPLAVARDGLEQLGQARRDRGRRARRPGRGSSAPRPSPPAARRAACAQRAARRCTSRGWRRASPGRSRLPRASAPARRGRSASARGRRPRAQRRARAAARAAARRRARRARARRRRQVGVLAHERPAVVAERRQRRSRGGGGQRKRQHPHDPHNEVRRTAPMLGCGWSCRCSCRCTSGGHRESLEAPRVLLARSPAPALCAALLAACGDAEDWRRRRASSVLDETLGGDVEARQRPPDRAHAARSRRA